MATKVGERVKVRYRKGVFEPLEPIDLPEDTEGEVIIRDRFFELLDKARANIQVSGISSQEFNKIVQQECKEARKRTAERVRRRLRASR